MRSLSAPSKICGGAFIFVSAVALLGGCSNPAFACNSLATEYQRATDLYNQEKFSESSRLFETIARRYYTCVARHYPPSLRDRDFVAEQLLAAGEVAHMARENGRAIQFVTEALKDFEQIRPVLKGDEALSFHLLEDI